MARAIRVGCAARPGRPRRRRARLGSPGGGRDSDGCRTAGNWLFCNRRWLDPAQAEDRAQLDRAYGALCASFPAFASCSKADFLRTLAEVAGNWANRIRA
jgi:hypothetical protein